MERITRCQNLLKQSIVVRTAVPTKIIYGETPDIQVVFAGTSQLLSYIHDYKKFLRQLRALKPSLALPEVDQKNVVQRVFTPNTRKELPEIDVFRDYLHMVTTDVQVAPSVQEVIVYQPVAFLKQNIIIILYVLLAEVTVAVVRISRKWASVFGCLSIRFANALTCFCVKPPLATADLSPLWKELVTRVCS